jgi:hypothetical protein
MEKIKDVVKELALLYRYGKLTMKCCKKVLDERKEQPGEDGIGDKGAGTFYKW